MYRRYFGLNQSPFNIAPDARFLFLSDSHREAIAHLVYALEEKGGFAQLTGEVGLGKTTITRYVLSKIPQSIDVALILNPRVDETDLLRTLCDELHIKRPKKDNNATLTKLIFEHLLKTHEKGRQTILLIDEAQNLPIDTLEQIRLLTNLETSEQKLLRIILIGQPELARKLESPVLRQLAQRITGRYRLEALNHNETEAYIQHRLKIAGTTRQLFSRSALNLIYKLTKGTPRLINLLCDRALMGAYSQGLPQVTRQIVRKASKESLPVSKADRGEVFQWLRNAALMLAIGVLGWWLYKNYGEQWLQDRVTKNNEPLKTSQMVKTSGTETNT